MPSRLCTRQRLTNSSLSRPTLPLLEDSPSLPTYTPLTTLGSRSRRWRGRKFSKLTIPLRVGQASSRSNLRVKAFQLPLSTLPSQVGPTRKLRLKLASTQPSRLPEHLRSATAILNQTTTARVKTWMRAFALLVSISSETL